ncbi:MAG: molybdopterin-binding protein [Deltaproteobacteria bacterium]|jgi:molybdenum cofactor synthesis domain-containing protein|nr:molybdopterin-binding protein [Deltaproteobacteria bacterium]
MKSVPTVQALGLILCHDITEIVPGEQKRAAFKKGHVVREEDIPLFLRLGKENIFVWSDVPDGQAHEDEAALRLARIACGLNLSFGEPSEGRIDLRSEIRGLLTVKRDLLEAVNDIPLLTVVTAHGNREVKPGQIVAGTRAIPLCVPEEALLGAEKLCLDSGPILNVLPLAPHLVGVVTTGSEVYHGRVQDGFTPVLRRKFASWGSSIHCHALVPDEPSATAAAIREALKQGATLVAVTGGMSVDPDDKTPTAIREVCGEVVTYGVPAMPGAMFMLGYVRDIAILGLPGCVMYERRASIFDLVAPRLLAGQRLTRRDFTALAHGGLCAQCPECSFPDCSFGCA